MNGPTILLSRNGRMRFTANPGPIDACRDSITMSSIGQSYCVISANVAEQFQNWQKERNYFALPELRGVCFLVVTLRLTEPFFLTIFLLIGFVVAAFLLLCF